jgi:protein ImuB
VQFRYPHFVFVDIDSTAGLFGGELQLMKQAVDLARGFAPQATAAVASTTYFAQVLVQFRPFEVVPENEDLNLIKTFSIAVIGEMEGLFAWPKIRQIEHIVQFFQSLGLHTLEEIWNFPLSSFRERWGEVGVTAWNRLHALEKQVISPLSTQDPLTAYGYFDEPVSLLPVLQQSLGPQLHLLFLRLQGLQRNAQKLELILFCEYSDKQHTFFVEPVSPSRDAKLFYDLMCRKLSEFSLENPIREFELQVFDAPDKVHQLDFFEPRDTSEDRWRRLISFAKQANVEMGFLQQEAAHLPEQSYKLITDWPKDFNPKDFVERRSVNANEAVQLKSVFAKALAKSPRPSLLLREPQLLSQNQIHDYRLLSRIPSERIESSWWLDAHEVRDYYFALSQKGQLTWVFQDRSSKNYYLHGYFD